jgi:hypothetical protein
MASPVGPVGECAVLLLKVLDASFAWASSRSSWVCYCRYSLDGAEAGLGFSGMILGASEATIAVRSTAASMRELSRCKIAGSAARTRMPRPGA